MSKIDKQGNNLEADEVFMIKEGILNAWVCAPKSMTLEQVQTHVDQNFVSGTRANWIVQHIPEHEDEQFLSPGCCAEDDNRQHWNCVC